MPSATAAVKDWFLLHYAAKALPSTKTLAAFDLRSRPSIVVAERTRGYHAVVRSHVQPTDVVLEIGSAYGDCLEAAHLRCKEAKYIGVDISEEAVTESRARFPHIQFEQVDVVQNPEKLIAIAQRATLIAIDINGNRAMASVIAVLASVEKLLTPDIVVIKSSELFELGRKHMKEAADGDASAGSSSGLVALARMVEWKAKLALEALTQKACEHCKRQLCYKPKFSIVWESVRWCSYNCKLQANDGAECDNTNLLLNNKKYEQLVGLMVPNSLAVKTPESAAAATDAAAATAAKIYTALQPLVGKSLGSAVRVWTNTTLGRGCCGAETGDKQVILAAVSMVPAIEDSCSSSTLQLDLRFETWGMVEKSVSYVIERPTGFVTQPQVSIIGNSVATLLFCDGFKLERPAAAAAAAAAAGGGAAAAGGGADAGGGGSDGGDDDSCKQLEVLGFEPGEEEE